MLSIYSIKTTFKSGSFIFRLFVIYPSLDSLIQISKTNLHFTGEQSLAMTIVNLAQNYVGSNNINLLEPRGQFGTRLCGGKDSASPRYIFTLMSPLTRLVFHPHDDPLLVVSRYNCFNCCMFEVCMCNC